MFKKFLLMVFAALVVLVVAPIAMQRFEHAAAQDAATSGELDSAGFMFDLGSITHEKITGGTKQSFIRKGINYFFERIITFMAATIGGLAVLFMSIGGFLVLTSAGDQNQLDKGKNFIQYSAMGLVFALGAYVIVNAVQLLIANIYG
jgi:hypothetical protein